MIVAFTVRQAVTLKEVARSQRLFAVYADEMLRMPEPRQRCNHLQIIVRSSQQLIMINDVANVTWVLLIQSTVLVFLLK